MTDPLRSPEDYELFVYTLSERFSTIRRSTLTFVRRGRSLARVSGAVQFDAAIRLAVLERLVFDRRPGVIESYSYEVWKGEEKLYWYDSQPHPNHPDLQSTHPHHKHVPPDIKHNRIPAPEVSFIRPNLPVLIREIEALLEEASKLS